MRNIIAAVDLSAGSARLLEQAGELAKGLGATLWILHATMAESSTLLPDLHIPDLYGMTEVPMPLPVDIQHDRALTAEKFRREHAWLNAASARLRARGVETISLLLRGDAVAVVMAKAAELPADLIVIGSHGHGKVFELLVGSTCEAILRAASCPVLVVPSPRGE